MRRPLASLFAMTVPLATLAWAPTTMASDVTASGSPEQTCSQLTGSTNSIMLSNISSTDKQYQCAYTDDHGLDKIGGWQTESWASNAPAGYSADYTDTSSDGSSGFTWANSFWGGSSVGTTWNAQPTNWNANTQKWGACILWSTSDYSKDGAKIQSSQYRSSCKDGDMQAFRMYPVSMTMTTDDQVDYGNASTFRLTVNGSAYDGDSPAEGTVVVYLQTGASPNPAADTVITYGSLSNGAATLQRQLPSTGTFVLYAVYGGSSTDNPSIPGRGWTPVVTDSVTVTVTDDGGTDGDSFAGGGSSPWLMETGTIEPAAATQRASERASLSDLAAQQATFRGDLGTAIVEDRTSSGGELSVACPAGGVPTQFNVLSTSAQVSRDDLELLNSGVSGARLNAPTGAETGLQVICRELDAPMTRQGRVTFGSARADRMVTDRDARQTLFAGLGNDILRVSTRGSVGWGGPGSDTITASARDTVAAGGFGNDTLRSIASERTLLIGGPGEDVLIGGPGETLINARDGKGGDTVACRSPRNRVLADDGDTVIGPCEVL